MIIYKTWYSHRTTPMYNTKYKFQGVFLFGFIPLYIHRTVIPTNSI